jgi:hypothetical protein
MPMSRRRLLIVLGASSTASLLPRAAYAAYPDHPIRLIVPFAAGGNADIVGRIVGEQISQALGQPVVVDNRGGAGGSIGAEAVARGTPDGYMLLVGSNGPLTVNPFVQAKLGYDPLKDFAPIALTSYVPHTIILNNKVEAKTVGDLIALSKRQPVTIATSGVGSATHMTLERLKAQTGANFTHIPLQERRRVDAGSDRRQHPGRDDGALHGAAAAQRRSGAYRRHCGGATLEARAGGSDLHRRRREGFHRIELYRHPGAGRDAAGNHRAIAKGDRRRTDQRTGARQITRHGL